MKATGNPSALIPHVGWLEHEPEEQVVELLRQGHFEAEEQAFFWRFLRADDTFLDCGAHIGLYTVLAWRAMGKQAQKLVAVEASASTTSLLLRNIQNNDVKAEIIQAAVWSDTSGVSFDMSTPGRAAYARISGAGKTRVPSVTLDNIVTRNFAGPVTLLKLDVEGAEPDALRGAAKAIKNRLLPVVMVELTESNLAQTGRSTVGLVEQLSQLGYQVCAYDATANEVRPVDREVIIWHMNAIACIDVDEVNRRLAGADGQSEIIAQDLLGRAAACSKFKELEEFDRLKGLAEESEKRRAWAEKAEANLRTARERVTGSEDWAKRSDVTLAQTKALLKETRQWALASDEALAKQKARAEEMEKWARRSDAALVERNTLLEQVQAWARNSDNLLAQRAAELEDTLTWARKSDAALVQRAAELEEALAWARRSEAALVQRTAELEETLGWARNSDAALVERAAELEAALKWARTSDASLIEANALVGELKAWAEGAESRLSAASAKHDQAQEDIDALRVCQSDLEAALSALTAQHTELQAQRSELAAQHAELEVCKRDLTAALAASEGELDRISWKRRWARWTKARKAPR